MHHSSPCRDRRTCCTRWERAQHWEQLAWCCGARRNLLNLKSVTFFRRLVARVCVLSSHICSSSILQHQYILLRDYIRTVLGPFIRALRAGTQLCSLRLCRGNGRCARRRLGSGRTFASGPALTSDPEEAKHFACQCYPGWAGQDCQEKIQH